MTKMKKGQVIIFATVHCTATQFSRVQYSWVGTKQDNVQVNQDQQEAMDILLIQLVAGRGFDLEF